MSTSVTESLTRCAQCGAVLKADAACTSCLQPAGDEVERARRYENLPPRVPTGGIIMPQ
jgi:hypothetical protein